MGTKQANTTGQDSVGKLVRRNLSPGRVLGLFSRGARSIYHEGVEATWRKIAFRACIALKRPYWRYVSDRPTGKELRFQKNVCFEKQPCISILVPLYNTPPAFLRQMVESCLAQSYPNWQLCLADASTDSGAAQVLATYKDARITYVKLAENAGIAGNTNAAAALAGGTYLALLDHDDVLYPNALYEMVKAINETGADFIYSDEIVLSQDLKQVKEYHFKPAFSPDYLRGCNYITHFSLFSTQLFKEVGEEDPAFDGAQDHDLFLRLSERAAKIHHIPKILYIWRAHGGSTAGEAAAKPYAAAAGARAVQAQLTRLALPGKAEAQTVAGSYRVRYEVQGTPLVSVVIPNKDHVEDLRLCLSSFHAHAGYAHYEIIIVENNSDKPETQAFYQEAQAADGRVRLVQYVGAFNFSAICNLGVSQAKGEYILLLNNDIEFVQDGFLYEMLSYAQRSDVGAVGAKLAYPDGTLQHGGVFIGLGGSAGHSHKGHPKDNAGDMFRLSTTQNLAAVTGACLLTKTALYRQLGGLDETHFKVAYNDVDYCLRLCAAGYINVFTPFAYATHYESKSRGYEVGSEAEARYNSERDAFRAKYARLLEAGDPYYNPHLTLKTENYAFDAKNSFTSGSLPAGNRETAVRCAPLARELFTGEDIQAGRGSA
ncbi:glycosyltransferase family 2 protein [Ruminococcaceae bacterium OttesenSCG-928-N02]|nr:glycosyltransferase family 2 protein [Ruminococcaceae bacterium OttesenSCG-928-N02]